MLAVFICIFTNAVYHLEKIGGNGIFPRKILKDRFYNLNMFIKVEVVHFSEQSL